MSTTTIPTIDGTDVLCTCSHTHPGSDSVCTCVHKHAAPSPTTVIVNGDEDSKKETGDGFLRGVEIFFSIVAKAIQGLVFLVVLIAGGLVSSVRWAGVKIAEARAGRKLKKDLAEEAAEEPGVDTLGDTEKSPRQEATRTAPASEPSAQKPSPSKPAAPKPKAKKTKARKEATLCSLCDKPAVNVWVTSSDLILAECEDHGGSPELKIQMGWVKK